MCVCEKIEGRLFGYCLSYLANPSKNFGDSDPVGKMAMTVKTAI